MRIRAYSFVFILAALLAKVLLADGKVGLRITTAEHLLDMGLDAVVIAGIVAFLGETRPFKSYLEDRLKSYASQTSDRYETLLARSFLERATDERSLRGYSRDTLRQIERSVQHASLPDRRHPEIDQLLGTLNDMRDRMSIWRTGWREYLIWQELDGHPDLCLIRSELQMHYVNGSLLPQALPLTVSDLTLATLDDDTKLYKLTTVEFDGKALDTSAVRTTKEDGRITFETTLPEQHLLPTPPDGAGTPFLQRTEVVYTRHESHVLTFFLPVKGFELFLEHPAGLAPEVVVFGVGGSEVTDPLPPVHASPTQHHWRYTGWLLESSGVVLSFSHQSK